MPKELTAEEAKYILGGQGNVWTEYLKTPEAVEYMAFPRMLALSEVVWSRAEDKNFDDFQRRLGAQFPRLDKQNVNYRIPEPRGLQNSVTTKSVVSYRELSHPIAESRIYYTMDGTELTEKSKLYNKGLLISRNRPKNRYETIASASGAKALYTGTFLRRVPSAVDVRIKTGGEYDLSKSSRMAKTPRAG